MEKSLKKIVRHKKQYINEERAAIRASLLAGQEAALKRRENEAKKTRLRVLEKRLGYHKFERNWNL